MADILLLATERTFGDAPAGGVGALVVSVAGAAGDKKPRGKGFNRSILYVKQCDGEQVRCNFSGLHASIHLSRCYNSARSYYALQDVGPSGRPPVLSCRACVCAQVDDDPSTSSLCVGYIRTEQEFGSITGPVGVLVQTLNRYIFSLLSTSSCPLADCHNCRSVTVTQLSSPPLH